MSKLETGDVCIVCGEQFDDPHKHCVDKLQIDVDAHLFGSVVTSEHREKLPDSVSRWASRKVCEVSMVCCSRPCIYSQRMGSNPVNAAGCKRICTNKGVLYQRVSQHAQTQQYCDLQRTTWPVYSRPSSYHFCRVPHDRICQKRWSIDVLFRHIVKFLIQQ